MSDDDDMAGMEIEDTRPLRAQEVEGRLQQVRTERKLNGGLTAGLAQTAGIEPRELPQELPVEAGAHA